MSLINALPSLDRSSLDGAKGSLRHTGVSFQRSNETAQRPFAGFFRNETSIHGGGASIHGPKERLIILGFLHPVNKELHNLCVIHGI